MNIDPYATCPCGSGKKVKWCCQDIRADIQRAFDQENEGQHEAAVRILDDLASKHPDKAEIFGRKAQLLFAHGQIEEGEAVLQKSFDIDPNYPFGLLLRARLRLNEGEVTGAVMLARRAAEAYDPAAADQLSEVYSLIADAEMHRHRPLAAHAALRILQRFDPTNPELSEAIKGAFGEESRMPPSARKEYTFRSPPAGIDPARRKAWDAALSGIEGPRLGAAAAAFEKLTAEDTNDAAAFFNLGLVQAWLGENRKAVEALRRYVELEQDDARATEAATLVEVLLLGQGMESESDYRTQRVEYQVRDFAPVQALLQKWDQDDRFIVLRTPDESVLAALLLEPIQATVVTSSSGTSKDRKFAAYILARGDRLRLWSPLEEPFNRVRDEIRTHAGLALAEGPVQTGYTDYVDVVAPALFYPLSAPTREEANEKALEQARLYYEEKWIHEPRKSLAGNSPLDAAGHRTLRKRLLGVIQFIQESAAGGALNEYDFDRLRRKLDLPVGGSPAPTPTPSPTAAPVPAAAPSGVDVWSMGTPELAALKAEALSDEQLEQAYQASQKLDATELSAHFARALAARPIAEGRTLDRYAVFSHLVQHALREGKLDEALDMLNEGTRVDCEHNEGRRRNEYELRRGQLHAKRGEVEPAHAVFSRLIERSPDEIQYRGSAAEAMLSLRQPARARQFAEDGLAVARRNNDRDSEQYLMELVEAAKKQVAK